MTEKLFLENPYQQRCSAEVRLADRAGVVLDRTVFYPRGGGQPGDTGHLVGSQGPVGIVDTIYGADGNIVHVPDAESELPTIGSSVAAVIDWTRRYAHMRMHTALHLLGVALPYGVTGGNISAQRSRLDFDLPDSPDKENVEKTLNALIAQDLPVRSFWISEKALDERPELVRTLSVRPPKGAGNIRLLEIPGLDLQPCGGTHVARTGEIGPMRVTKIEKKGRRNRRVYLEFG